MFCQCNEQACLNALLYQNNLDEYRAYDPEILENLEINVINNQDDDNVFDILERPDEHDEDKEI